MTGSKETHTQKEIRVREWRNTVEITVSSRATNNQVIDRPCSCISSFGTSATPKDGRCKHFPEFNRPDMCNIFARGVLIETQRWLSSYRGSAAFFRPTFFMRGTKKYTPPSLCRVCSGLRGNEHREMFIATD